MSFHDLIHTILSNIKFLLKVTVISSVIIFVLLLFVYPRTYNAEVVLLPPEQKEDTGPLTALLGGADYFSGLMGMGFQSGNSQLFMQILKSRTAALYVVRKLNLTDYFDTEIDVEAAKKLSGSLNLNLTKEGIIKLNVDISSKLLPWLFDDKDSLRRFAALVSNTYVEALDSINKAKLTSKAKRARVYIESQLVKTKAALDSAEFALMEFQKENKTISLPEQISASIDAAAKLKSQIIETEIEIGYLEKNLREDNRLILSLKKKLQELKEQYDKMQMGSKDYLLAFADVPELGKKLADLLRNVKIQNEVYLLLQQQYYKEKIQENRDIPTVEILDEAIPPTRASSPRIIFSTVISGIFIFLLLSVFVVVKEKKNIELRNKIKGS